jgi:hypothetical protein
MVVHLRLFQEYWLSQQLHRCHHQQQQYLLPRGWICAPCHLLLLLQQVHWLCPGRHQDLLPQRQLKQLPRCWPASLSACPLCLQLPCLLLLYDHPQQHHLLLLLR